MRVVTVVGARPQFVKAAMVSQAILASEGITEEIIHTGQHYDRNMSDLFFGDLGIPEPAYRFNAGQGSHGAQTGLMLTEIESVLMAARPDWVLVYGDTNSTLAGALAAAKLHIPVAHVEAGLRSFNRKMPEEINRILTDHVSELLLPPTQLGYDNLSKEGLLTRRVEIVGDVMYDACLQFREAERVKGVVASLGLEPGRYILATIHRAENTDNLERLTAILGGLGEAAKEMPVFLPLHPRTRKVIEAQGIELAQSIRIVEPVGFLEMVALEKDAALIATDSGGVQKEAFFFEVPCVTLRNETEWLELVQMGWNTLCPPVSVDAVASAIESSLGTKGQPGRPYGDGDAGSKVVAALLA